MAVTSPRLVSVTGGIGQVASKKRTVREERSTVVGRVMGRRETCAWPIELRGGEREHNVKSRKTTELMLPMSGVSSMPFEACEKKWRDENPSSAKQEAVSTSTPSAVPS